MIEFGTVTLPSTPPGPLGLPLLDDGGGRTLDAAARALVGVGEGHRERPASLLPWRRQSGYTRAPEAAPTRTAVLDNGRLRATFLLDWGGRLWSLVDLTSGRELLFQPDTLQLANLGLRDAWFSGGVEWNLGITGHWALTASPVSAAVVERDGVQVLRLWGYERMLELTWRLDAWLPDGSDELFVHPHVHNPHATERPVYWWSNGAVPATPGTRVLADADTSFHYGHVRGLVRAAIPEFEGVDVTRPARAHDAVDYFFDLPPSATHPWVAAVEPDGAGVVQASTARLRGRKLFVWGTDRGGEHWQAWLNGTGRYAEIQAGLAPTQFEHLALAPGETWSWTESYRALSIGPDAAASGYLQALDAARPDAARRGSLDEADAVLAAMAAEPVPGGWSPGHGGAAQAGWGGVAVALGDVPSDPATPYPDPAAVSTAESAEQRLWLRAGAGEFDEGVLCGTTLVGEGWRDRLAARAAEGAVGVRGAAILGQLGFAAWAAGESAVARAAWSRSRALHPSAPVSRALGLAEEAAALAPGVADYAVELVAQLGAEGRFAAAQQVLDGLDAGVRAAPRVQYLQCVVAVGLGDAEGARRILAGPLVVPDLREGDQALDVLWAGYQARVGGSESLPEAYDFRMHASARIPGVASDLGATP